MHKTTILLAVAMAMTACGDPPTKDTDPVDTDTDDTVETDTVETDTVDTDTVDTDTVETDTDTDTDPPAPTPNVIFLTSNTYLPAFAMGADPFAGADTFCETAATNAGLAGTFVAFMGADGVTPVSRLGTARGWVTPSGLPVADTAADLNGHTHFNRAVEDELGAVVDPPFFWSGQGPAQNDCEGWTNTTSGSAGHGTMNNVGQFLWGNDTPCNVENHLLCMGIDNIVEVVPEPAPAGARLAFLSTTQVSGNDGGLSSYDERCQTDFEAEYGAGTGRTFAAMIASIGTAPRDRVPTTDAVWVRPDNTIVARTTADFVSGAWLAHVNRRADGSRGDKVAFGASGLAGLGTTGSTCDDWSSTTGTYARAEAARWPDKFGGYETPCSTVWLSYCVETTP